MADQKNSRWKAGLQQRNFTSQLLKALKSPEKSTRSIEISPSLAVKEAADSALAMAAKGRTRWSRAILARRRKFRLRTIKRVSIRRRLARFNPPPPPPPETKGICRISAKRKREKESDPFGSRLQVLARLIPGAKKLPAPVLLEEATDYIAALEMQVRAMSALADLLSATSLVPS